MRRDNSHHLVAAAQRRRADTLERARQALQELGETGQRHTVTQIAAHAGVSRSWLYAQPELRDQLRRLTAISEPRPIGTRPNRARLRRLAAATPHPRTRTHPRTRRRKPSTAQPDRTPARTTPRQPHRRHPRHGHRPRRKHPAHAAKQPNPPKITLARFSSRSPAKPLELRGLFGRHPRTRTVVDLGLAHPLAQRLGVPTPSTRHRPHRRPLGLVLTADLGHHPHRPPRSPIPNMPATAVIAAHCDGYCGRTSATMRTARSRSSSGYLLGRPITRILPRSGVSGNPGTAHGDLWPPHCGTAPNARGGYLTACSSNGGVWSCPCDGVKGFGRRCASSISRPDLEGSSRTLMSLGPGDDIINDGPDRRQLNPSQIERTPEISWSWNHSGEPLTHDESFVPPNRTVHKHP